MDILFAVDGHTGRRNTGGFTVSRRFENGNDTVAAGRNLCDIESIIGIHVVRQCECVCIMLASGRNIGQRHGNRIVRSGPDDGFTCKRNIRKRGIRDSARRLAGTQFGRGLGGAGRNESEIVQCDPYSGIAPRSAKHIALRIVAGIELLGEFGPYVGIPIAGLSVIDRAAFQPDARKGVHSGPRSLSEAGEGVILSLFECDRLQAGIAPVAVVGIFEFQGDLTVVCLRVLRHQRRLLVRSFEIPERTVVDRFIGEKLEAGFGNHIELVRRERGFHQGDVRKLRRIGIKLDVVAALLFIVGTSGSECGGQQK